MIRFCLPVEYWQTYVQHHEQFLIVILIVYYVINNLALLEVNTVTYWNAASQKFSHLCQQNDVQSLAIIIPCTW